MSTVVKSQILLNNIRLYAYHGVLEQERTVGGWYSVTLTIDYPLAKAMETDCVDDTLDYAKVLEVVVSEMKKRSRLIEHVAGRILSALTDNFPLIEAAEILLTKENPPMGCDTAGASVRLSIKNDTTNI